MLSLNIEANRISEDIFKELYGNMSRPGYLDLQSGRGVLAFASVLKTAGLTTRWIKIFLRSPQTAFRGSD